MDVVVRGVMLGRWEVVLHEVLVQVAQVLRQLLLLLLLLVVVVVTVLLLVVVVAGMLHTTENRRTQLS